MPLSAGEKLGPYEILSPLGGRHGRGLQGARHAARPLRRRESSPRPTAVALCFDNRASLDGLERPNDNEIRLRLEHANGDSLDVQLCYHKRALMGYRYGALAAVKRENKFFFGT